MNGKTIVGIVFVILILCGTGFFLLKTKIQRPLSQNDLPFVATSTVPTNDVVLSPGQKLYSDEAFGFKFAYPEEFTVQVYKEAGNAKTITFEDPSGERDFQIYIAPYSTQITAERIKLDAHVVDGTPQEAVIGNMHALIFFSEQPEFGKLREVWFTNSGRLFEVTTAAENDSWIAGVMSTWRFGAGSVL